MNVKKKVLTMLLMAVVTVSVLLTGCQLPEIEGTIVAYNNEMYDNALKTALDATQKYPDNADAWFWLGKVYYKKNRLEDMVNAFDKSLAISEVHKAEIKQIEMREFASNFNYAIKLLNAAIKETDTEKKAKIQQEINKKLTIAYFCNRDYAMTYVLLAKNETDLGNKEKGLQLIDEAATKFADKDTVLYNIGNYFMEQQDRDKAQEYYEKAYNINSDNADVILALADIYMAKKEFAKAKDFLSNILDKNPDNVNILFNVAALYYNLKEYDKAVEYFSRVISLDDQNKFFWEYYAQALFNAEMFDKTVTELSRGVEIVKDSPLMYEILSYAYTRIGKIEEAQAAAAKAKELKGE